MCKWQDGAGTLIFPDKISKCLPGIRKEAISSKKGFLMSNCLYIVIPCYNEQEVLGETALRLKNKIIKLQTEGKVSEESKIVFVNDGSKDQTWNLICELHRQEPLFLGINLSRNRGHQNALLAGLLSVKKYADVVISMDADLQDDINAVDQMIDKFQSGFDVVYGVRNKRETDTFFKRATAEAFYKLMNLMGAGTVYNHADYRLLSKRALYALEKFKEVNLFLRGIVPMIGFPSDVVYYERGERYAGESKYPLKKMLSFAVEGITSLSIKPMRMITGLGFLVFLMSIATLIYSLVRHFTGETIVGWTTLMVSIWAIGGLILLSIGVLGEYIGKIYLETKERPRFIVEEFLGKPRKIKNSKNNIIKIKRKKLNFEGKSQE